jgi:hypothetical protein
MYSRFLRTVAIALAFSISVACLARVGMVQAQSGNQWRIDYYPNLDWAGAPVYTQFANVVNFNWGTNSPGPNMPASNWTARMTSDVFFLAGIYRFSLVADDEFVLAIDGINYFNTTGLGQSGKAFVVDIGLTQGIHRVQLDFRQFSGLAYVSTDWQYLKEGGPAPSPSLEPPPPTPNPGSVVTRFGDFTRCIQQNLHQAECFQSDGHWDSPNLGSIQLEPKIVLWGQCKADEIQRKQLFANSDPQPAKCSKSEAGWFPN